MRQVRETAASEVFYRSAAKKHGQRMARGVHRAFGLSAASELGDAWVMVMQREKKAFPRFSRAILIGLGTSVITAALVAACVQPPADLSGFPTGGAASSSSGGGNEDGGKGNTAGRDMWKAMEADVMSACGLCHDVGGLADTPFLAGPDRYQSFVSWPGIVASNPQNSILLTYAMTGKGHSGTNLDSAALKDTLLPKVQAWLAEEAGAFTEPPPQVGPHIEPFAPIMGFNAVYLGPLGADLEGMAITFSADLLAETTLELSNIELHPTSKAGVHIVHPLFVVHPLGQTASPDPVDSFSNVDQTFPAGESGTVGPGTLILVNWSKDAKLSLAFETIAANLPADPDAGVDGGTTGGCKDLTSFNDNAKTPLGVCTGCHGGGNGQAVAAVDMSGLGGDTAKACAQIKNRVNPSDPPNSQLFVTTDPNGNAAHPFKFGGNDGAFNNFRDSVSIWVAAEK